MSEMVVREQKRDGANPGDGPNHAQSIYDMFIAYVVAPKPLCLSVALSHACMTPAGGWSNETIGEHVWLHTKDQALLEDELRQKASEYAKAARDHADTFDASQRYSVVCYGKGGDEQILKRYDFRVAPSQRSKLLLGETEPATEAGLAATAVRLAEAITESTFTKDAMLFQTMRAQIEHLTKENQEMRAQAFEHMKATQEMIMARHKLELELEMARLDPKRAEAERTAGIWNLAVPVVSKMVENVTGAKLLGPAVGSAPDDVGPVVELIRSIPPDKIATILSRLTDDEKARFASAAVGKANGVS